MAHLDIRLEETNLICFPVSIVCFFVGEEPKSIAKPGGAIAEFSPFGSNTVYRPIGVWMSDS